MNYSLRKYQEADCVLLADLFFRSIHTTCQNDYSQEQLNAWANGKVDLTEWHHSFCEHYTVVAALDNGVIVGFGDIDINGYLDRLFVHPDYQRQGIATAICNKLESVVKVETLSVYASITAQRFFEKRGYVTIKSQSVARKGILLRNYLMEKRLV
ncbi:GNAT family N-acetyltransferase [Gallibacterium salpingitidis]|uniref:GNAT family N-acetyltransferase n=1 Tax=Gallibacterium salpingitidis TaxID=505341 RepID=UPI00266F0BCF|nr:GNAT family N-acetyltransferase [Gallibacterium salpingitidis]WKT00761.1 GNAT family N-acetyltransferase [Gallibacterium salpingitidis]